MPQSSILIAGCGDVGSALAYLLAQAGHKVTGLRRNINQLGQGIHGLAADLAQPTELKENLKAVKACDLLVYSVAASEHTEAGYQQAYVDGLSNLLAALPVQPKHIFFTSSTSVYAQKDHSWVDEASECLPGTFSGKIMLKAEQNLAAHPIPSTVVRFSGIYGPGRNFLLNKVRNGDIAPEAPTLYSNRIHRDDCAGVLEHLINHLLSGGELEACYLATDDLPVSLHEVTSWLAAQVGVEPQTETASRRTGSKRCSNQRLKQLGYRFKYPDYRSGYRSLLETEG